MAAALLCPWFLGNRLVSAAAFASSSILLRRNGREQVDFVGEEIHIDAIPSAALVMLEISFKGHEHLSYFIMF